MRVVCRCTWCLSKRKALDGLWHVLVWVASWLSLGFGGSCLAALRVCRVLGVGACMGCVCAWLRSLPSW